MERPPNILVLLTTQWRASALGFAGDPNARTPHLDALAARSVNFAQAVTPHPFGPFARAALLTGVPSPQNGVRAYYDPLPAGARTVAHTLAERGYATAFFGKWHLARRDSAAPLVGETHARMIVPEDARGGFEFWEGFEGGFQLNDPWLHGTRRPSPEKLAGYQSEVICAQAAEFLSGQGGAGSRPFFCVVSLEAPHPPYDAPSADVGPRDPRTIVLGGNVPRGGEVEAKARRELAGYYAHIEATDRALGRWLLPLVARGDTVVIFTSVHGDMHGAHGLFRKGWPHDESVRVPLLLSRPGESPRREDGPVSLADLPEILGACVDRRPPVPARDFARISMPSVVALPQQCDRTWRGVRTKEAKFIFNDDGSPWLCFDLTNDPLEQHNRAADPAWAGSISSWQKRLAQL